MQGVSKRFRQLGKDTIIYGFGGAVAKSIGFLLLPVYTRLFTPAEYGIISMLTVIVSLLTAIVVMGMESALSFYFFKEKEGGKEEQAKIVTSIVQWHIIWGSFVVIIAMLFTPFINKWLFGGDLSWEYFAVAFSSAFFAQAINKSASVCRLLYKPFKYIAITLTKTITAAGLAIFLIVLFDKGIIGFFWGSLIASFFTSIWGFWIIKDYLRLDKLYWNLWPKLLRFAVPLVPGAFAMYVMNTSDKWFVNTIRGPEELGLYAVGVRFANIIMLIITTFRQAWWPLALDSLQKDDGAYFFRIVARLYLGGMVAGVVLLTYASPFLVRLLTAPDYFNSYPIVGILAWHSIFYGFYLISALGIWKMEKTYILPVFIFLSAIINIILNALLVPVWGGIGAAMATSISFLIWNIFVLYASERLWYVGYSYIIMALQVIVGIISCYFIITIYQNEISYFKAFLFTGPSLFIIMGLSFERQHFFTLLKYIKDKYIKRTMG